MFEVQQNSKGWVVVEEDKTGEAFFVEVEGPFSDEKTADNRALTLNLIQCLSEATEHLKRVCDRMQVSQSKQADDLKHFLQNN